MIDYKKFEEVRQLLLDEISSAEDGENERARWEVVRAFENAYPEHARNYFKSLGAA